MEFNLTASLQNRRYTRVNPLNIYQYNHYANLAFYGVSCNAMPMFHSSAFWSVSGRNVFFARSLLSVSISVVSGGQALT